MESRLLLGKLVGVGAFGEVYQAQDLCTGSACAVKVIEKSSDGNQGDGLVSRFGIMRLRQALQLTHPNIIRFREFIESPCMIYVVSDLYTGPDLFDFFQTHSPMAEDCAREIFVQILQALSFMHSLGYVHRDIKPENFKFENAECDNLRLLDCGSIIAERDAADGYTGTCGYAAPEVATCSYTCKCDMFSVGAALFLALAGNLPFPPKDDLLSYLRSLTLAAFDTMERQLATCMISFHALDFITSLLDFNPAQRPTAQEALERDWIRHIDANDWTQFG